jgi:hypothetical protein
MGKVFGYAVNGYRRESLAGGPIGVLMRVMRR